MRYVAEFRRRVSWSGFALAFAVLFTAEAAGQLHGWQIGTTAQTFAEAKYEAEEGGAKIAFRLRRYTLEQRVHKRKVVRRVPQRKVVEKIIDGKTVREIVIEEMPVETILHVEQLVRVPHEMRIAIVDFDKVAFYHLDGERAQEHEVADRLKKLAPVVFWAHAPESANVEPADEFVRKVIRPGTLLAVTDGVPLFVPDQAKKPRPEPQPDR